MKIVVMSNRGEFLPVVWRMKRQGTDAGIYVHHPKYRRNYENILGRIALGSLKKEVKSADIVIFDIVHANEKQKHDIALLKLFGLKSGSSSVFGAIADLLAKDHKVIGASQITEEIELDRRKGMELAKKMGFALPEYHEFKSISEGVKFLNESKELWVFKPDNNKDLDLTYVEKFSGELKTKMLNEYAHRLGDKFEYILQKKIEGIEISTEVWINSKGAVHYNHTLESKRLMDSDLGPAIGSQGNTVWVRGPSVLADRRGLTETKDEGPGYAKAAPRQAENSMKIIDCLAKTAEYLRTNNYIGPCDVNCIIKDGLPYFLEWSPRFGYDAFYCLMTLLKGSSRSGAESTDKLSDFFIKDFDVQFHDGYACSQRLSIPPYPYARPDLLSDLAKGVSIMEKLEDHPLFWGQDIYDDAGDLKCAGSDGILGIVSAHGQSLEEAWGRVYNGIRKIKVCSYVQFRTDGLKVSRSRLERFNNVKAA